MGVCFSFAACVLEVLKGVKERGSLRVNCIVSQEQQGTFFPASRVAHCGLSVITVLLWCLLGQIEGGS